MYNCIFYFSIYLQNKTIKNNIIYFHKICFIILIYMCVFVNLFHGLFFRIYIYMYIYIFQSNLFPTTFMFIIKKNVLGNIFITKEIIQISFFWQPKLFGIQNHKKWKVMKSDGKWWKVMISSLFITFHFLCFFL